MNTGVGNDAARVLADLGERAEIAVHRVVRARRDPVRCYSRQRRRARRSVVLRSIVALLLAWLAFERMFHAGRLPGLSPEGGPRIFDGAHIGGGATAILAGAAAVAVGVAALEAAGRLWRLQRAGPPPPLPPAPPLPGPRHGANLASYLTPRGSASYLIPRASASYLRPRGRARYLPPRGSASRPAMERLAERESVLRELLAHLGPAGGDSAAVAADAAATLRVHGRRIDLVDRARRGARPEARAGLDAALGPLVRQLDEGVAGYDALVVAAAEAVSASASLQAGSPLLAHRLADATDALAGLAHGLREVTAMPDGLPPSPGWLA